MAASPDDREEIDRAFAEIVAGFHLTTDRPDPLLSEPLIAEPAPDQRTAEARTADPRAIDPRGSELRGGDSHSEVRGELRGTDPSAERNSDRRMPDHAAEPHASDPLVARREETAAPAASALPNADVRPGETVPTPGGSAPPRPPELEPLFRFVPLVPAAVEGAPTDRAAGRRRLDDADPEQLERFVPPPLEPLPRPDLLTVLGWIGIGYSVLFVLITAVGLRLPGWAGWLAIAGFGGALVILISRQPRHRPPGDGAVV